MADLEKGDEVTWNTSQGETHGRVVDVHNEDIELHDQTFRGSDDDPVYVVESNKSGTRAAHKASALSKAALTVDDDERRATYDEFREVVNMTPSELERWLDSEHSQEVGAKPDDGGESVGHRSGRRIVALLRGAPGRPGRRRPRPHARGRRLRAPPPGPAPRRRRARHPVALVADELGPRPAAGLTPRTGRGWPTAARGTQAGVDLGTLLAIVGSGLATGVGGLALLRLRQPSDRLLDSLLGFTAGVMLAATMFSLLVPALEEGTVAEVVVALVAGAGLLAVLDAVVPHAHTRFSEHGELPAEYRAARERSALLLAAMTIHNVPEGMAVGVAFAGGGWELGLPLAVAIGLQNVPEGFAVAAPLLPAGVRPGRAAGVAALTGAVEPPAALLAFAVVDLAEPLLAAGLAFAAGAMLYVVVDELIPESQARGFEREATLSLLAGFVVMLVLDTALG